MVAPTANDAPGTASMKTLLPDASGTASPTPVPYRAALDAVPVDHRTPGVIRTKSAED
jgi:hypothetical protein